MRTKFIASLLVASALFSCNNKETKPAEAQAKKEEVSQDFKVTLDVNVSKDDSFHLYYTEDGSTNFTEESSVWAEFKAKPNSNQTIVFKLPENTIPTQMRLDFGVNKDQENIQINNFTMEYAGKSFNAAGMKFFNYFTPNLENTKVDKEKGLIIPVKGKDQYFGPSFYPMPDLAKEIAVLAK